ncbi:MAG: cytochrome c [Actinomycetota bacterium]|nr:cytochrome c [Actinomycetota bacterium]
MRVGGKTKRRSKLLLGGAFIVAALAALTGCDLQENADLDRGESLFVQKCGSCHALTAAGTNADIGPNLDQAFRESRANGMDNDTVEGVVQRQIGYPRAASPEDVAVYMPANLVEGEDAEAVAAYVASVAGVPGIQAPEFIASEFFATNCGGCHVLSAAGTTGAIGPNLDQVLPGQQAAQISDSIVNPETIISAGFPAGVMPANYGDTLTPEQLAALVDYLTQSIGGQPAGAGAPGSGVPSAGN